MRIALTATTGKIVASAAVVAAAAGVAGLGTFGSFTSTTSASTDTTSGTVVIALGANGTANRLNVAATGVVPGDTIQRAVQLSNTGNQNLSGLTLTTSTTNPTKLTTDVTNGLTLNIQSCPTAWTEAGVAPAYTYTCTSPTTVLSTRAVVGANVALPSLNALTAGQTDNLLVTLALPTAADNTFQGLNSTVKFDFTGTQRVATNR